MIHREYPRQPAPIQVTAALIPLQGRLFIAQRPPHKTSGLSWEFPGGKREAGESLEESLLREIKEELCWDIRVREFFHVAQHHNSSFKLDLHAFWCSIEGGNLCLREHVAFEWVFPRELDNYELTAADRQLVPLLLSLPQLPW